MDDRFKDGGRFSRKLVQDVTCPGPGGRSRSDGPSPCVTDIVLPSTCSDGSFKRLQPDSETIGDFFFVFFPRETKETKKTICWTGKRWMEDRGGEMKSLFGGKEDVISPEVGGEAAGRSRGDETRQSLLQPPSDLSSIQPTSIIRGSTGRLRRESRLHSFRARRLRANRSAAVLL